MDYQIRDIALRAVSACAEFTYKGYTISFSTILSGASVCIFTDETDTSNDKFFTSVEAAIDWINAGMST